jgi:hypothetical protein
MDSLVAGTSIGATTDVTGHGTAVNIPSLQDTLRFSFNGYEIKPIPVDVRMVIAAMISNLLDQFLEYKL